MDHAEKWRFALSLMSHVASKGSRTNTSSSKGATAGTPRPKAMAPSRSSGEPGAGLKPMQSIACGDLLQSHVQVEWCF